MKLSIITGAWNRLEMINRLISSVVEHTHGFEWELLIADASSPALPLGDSSSHNIRVYREVPRLGPSSGYNKLAEKATGSYICWLNDDVEVLPNWASAMIRSLSGRPHVGLGCFYFWTAQPSGRFHVQSDMGLLYANFGCMKLELFREVGGFDEECWKYGMDNSISLKVMREGLGVVAVEGATILHHKDSQEYAEPGDESRQRAALGHLRRMYGRYTDEFREQQKRFRPMVWELPLTVEDARRAVPDKRS